MKLVRSIKTNYITQKFGENLVPFYKQIGMKGHNGWDWKAKDNEKIYWDCLDCEGIVIDNHMDKNGGLGVKIITKDNEGTIKHLFWHLKGFACRPGDVLSTGDLIGWADNTGRSTGTHLHRGIKKVSMLTSGKWVNIDADNGYYGGIDLEPYFQENIYVKDYLYKLKKKLSYIQRIIDTIRRILGYK